MNNNLNEMKKTMKINFSKTVLSILAITVIMLAGCGKKETKKEKIGFKILIESNVDGIKLIAKEGCAFTELYFTLAQDKVEKFNQHGMVIEENSEIKSEENISNFLITIKKSNEEIVLNGLKGTSWESLSFSCPELGCTQLIDENGMQSMN